MARTSERDDLRSRFDALLTGASGLDPVAVHTDLRARAPVLWDERMGVHVVSRHADVVRILREETTFRPLTGGRGTPLFGRTILQMQGREHRAKSAIVSRRIRAPRALAGLQERVESVSARFADQLPVSVVVDMRERFTTWLPLTVVTDLLEVEEGVHWREWYDLMAAGGVSSITGDDEARRRGLAARDELFATIIPLVEERRQGAGDDLLSQLLAGEWDGHRLGDDEVLSFVAFLLTAGVETTDRVLSSLLRHLASTPSLWARLREDRDLVLPVCAEALRMFPPVQGLTREVVEPTTVGDTALQPGDLLLVLLASGNRDDAVFDDPDRFDAERFRDDAGRQFTGAASLLSFGGGRHHCTGAALARLEMQVGLDDLLDRFAALEPAGDLPAPEGFILRSPPTVPVRLVPARAPA